MAKISARGATEVARVKTQRGTSFLLRSDNTILIYVGVLGSGWKFWTRVKDQKAGITYLQGKGLQGNGKVVFK